MKLAFSTNAYTDGRYTLIDAMNRIANAGYAGVTILADYPLLWPLHVTKTELKEIKDTLEKRKLSVASVNGFTCSGFWLKKKWKKEKAPPGANFGPCFCDYQDENRRKRIEYTKKVIDFTKAIGGKDISTCSGILPTKGGTRALAWQHTVDGLRKVVAYAEKKGVRINIEYEPGLLVGSGEEAWQMIKKINSPHFGFNFDIGHSFSCEEDVPALIKRFAKKIYGVDVEDIDRDNNGKPIHSHLVPGQGSMPLEKIFKAFKSIGYNGWFIVELYTMYKRPVKVTHQSYTYLKQLEKKLQYY
ncbi:sugar phosphate isomerase/epimerase [Patescibacteria group bacterium AH-259-L05]|nr:sugar phosphate isomerase/epimerase [Patescibacteria group bacterium AH-259-L05]